MSGRFDIVALPIENLTLLQRKPLGDGRGYLERMFCLEELGSVLMDRTLSRSTAHLPANAARCEACTSNILRMRRLNW